MALNRVLEELKPDRDGCTGGGRLGVAVACDSCVVDFAREPAVLVFLVGAGMVVLETTRVRYRSTPDCQEVSDARKSSRRRFDQNSSQNLKSRDLAGAHLWGLLLPHHISPYALLTFRARPSVLIIARNFSQGFDKRAYAVAGGALAPQLLCLSSRKYNTQ